MKGIIFSLCCLLISILFTSDASAYARKRGPFVIEDRGQHGLRVDINETGLPIDDRLIDLAYLVNFVQEEIPVRVEKTQEITIKIINPLTMVPVEIPVKIVQPITILGEIKMDIFASPQLPLGSVADQNTELLPREMIETANGTQYMYRLDSNRPISGRNVAALAVVFHISLKGPSGVFGSDVCIMINANNNKFRLTDIGGHAGDKRGPSFETASYDALEQVVMDIVASIRTKAFKPKPQAIDFTEL